MSKRLTEEEGKILVNGAVAELKAVIPEILENSFKVEWIGDSEGIRVFCDSSKVGKIYIDSHFVNGKPNYSIPKAYEEKENKKVTPTEKGQPQDEIENNPLIRVMNDIIFKKDSEISELMEMIDKLELRSSGEFQKLKKENQELKKKIKELESRMIRDKEVYESITKYAKTLENKHNKALTQEQIDLIKNMVQQGKTEVEIVEASGTSKGTVWRVKKGLL